MIERKDKLKNKAEVAKTLIKNPLLTDREVAKKIWIGKSSVNRAKQDLGQDGTKEIDIMLRILEMDDEIIDLSNQITLAKIKKEAFKNEDWSIDIDKLSLQDIKTIWDLANNSTKRKAIFWDKNKWDEKDKVINITI